MHVHEGEVRKLHWLAKKRVRSSIALAATAAAQGDSTASWNPFQNTYAYVRVGMHGQEPCQTIDAAGRPKEIRCVRSHITVNSPFAIKFI